MTRQRSKLFKTRILSPPTFHLMSFLCDNIEAWFYYTEAYFYERGVIDPHIQILITVKALPRDLNKCGTPGMSTSDVYESYDTLKEAILRRGDLICWQRLNQPFVTTRLSDKDFFTCERSHWSTDLWRGRVRKALLVKTSPTGASDFCFISE